MNSRTRIAAATASVVPFHCVICFDEFSLDERPPVVLPCGHTFLCAPCSKRLKRCMECREPLFISLPAGSNRPTSSGSTNVRGVPPPPSMYSRPSGRHSPSPPTPPHSSTQPGPPVQIPIPIPKNVVLISMMEAATRQFKSAEKQGNSIDTNGSMDDDEEAYDLNNIINGLATLSGPCGTYAVRDESLVVTQHHPNRLSRDPEDDKHFEHDSKHGREPLVLTSGQTVQLVDFEDGVGRLARGMGFVVAKSSQLVKVNGPLDSTCRLEGLLDTVVRRGNDLQKELDENNRIEASIRKEIEIGLLNEPNYPVISGMPALSVAGSFDKTEAECSTPGSTKTNTGKEEHFATPERTASHEFLDVNYSSNGDPFISRLNSMDNSDFGAVPRLPSYRQMPDENLDFIYGCGAALLGNAHIFTGSGQESHMRLGANSLEDPIEDVAESSSRLRSTSSQRNGSPGLSPSLSASFDGVDFRTGMSGHRALNVTKSKVALSPKQRGGGRLMMSSHSGLGRLKGPPSNRNSAHSSAY